MYIFAVGLFKKVIIADTFGKAVTYGFGSIDTLSSMEAIVKKLIPNGNKIFLSSNDLLNREFIFSRKKSNYLEYALFVSFFPQLIAGPIVLHNEMIPQFRDQNRRHIHQIEDYCYIREYSGN